MPRSSGRWPCWCVWTPDNAGTATVRPLSSGAPDGGLNVLPQVRRSCSEDAGSCPNGGNGPACPDRVLPAATRTLARRRRCPCPPGRACCAALAVLPASVGRARPHPLGVLPAVIGALAAGRAAAAQLASWSGRRREVRAPVRARRDRHKAQSDRGFQALDSPAEVVSTSRTRGVKGVCRRVQLVRLAPEGAGDGDGDGCTDGHLATRSIRTATRQWSGGTCWPMGAGEVRSGGPPSLPRPLGASLGGLRG